jgi:quercetin dioxygenase-like cupin family protein
MSSKHIFSKGVQVSDNFTGTVFVNMLVPDTEGIYNCQAYDVLFEPGCRAYWHKHEGGQILLCTGGAGYYQEKGKPARRLAKGDVVEIPPHVAHWHGAAPDSEFNHIGISPNTNKGGCTWLSPVTDEEYKGALNGK